MLRSLILVMAALSSSVLADEVMVGVYTDHLQSGEFNEANQLIGWRGDRFFAATFENSNSQRTYAAGAYSEWGGNGFHGGVHYGAMYGYCAEAFRYGKKLYIDDCEPTLLPTLAPYVGWKNDYVSVRALGLGTAVTITIGIEI